MLDAAFATPSSQLNYSDDAHDHADRVRQSGLVFANDRHEENYEPRLRSCIASFLAEVEGARRSDDGQIEDKLLRFILANGTVYTNGSCKHEAKEKDTGQLKLSRGSIFIQHAVKDGESDIFGLVHFGCFFPISGIFEIFHQGQMCTPRKTEGNWYSRVSTTPQDLDENENFFSPGPFGKKLCSSTEQTSDECRYQIYQQKGLRVLLDEKWLIFERWIDINDETYIVPLLFSETGQRFNYILTPSRHLLRDHLRSNCTDITYKCWEQMLSQSRPVCSLVFFWREMALRRLISIENFSDRSFNSRLFELTLACPIAIESGYRITTGIDQCVKELLRSNKVTDSENLLKQIKRRTDHAVSGPGLSSGLHSKVLSLNALLKNENGEFFSRKPEFCIDLDSGHQREEHFAHHLSEYKQPVLKSMKIEVKGFLNALGYPFEEEECFGPRTFESRWKKIRIITDLFQTPWQDANDLYAYFKDLDSPQDFHRLQFAPSEGVVIQGETDYTDTNSEILRGLYLNLNFYMKTLPELAFSKCSNEAHINSAMKKRIWRKIHGY